MNGLRLHDLQSGRACDFPHPNAEETPVIVGFLPDDSALIVSVRSRGLFRLTFPGGWASAPVNPQWELLDPLSRLLCGITADGRRALVTRGSDRNRPTAHVVPLRADGGAQFDLQGGTSEYAEGLSPDGRWAVTGSVPGGHARIWDLLSGRKVREFASHYGDATFSPDSRWMLLRSRASYALYDATRAWAAGPVFLPPEGHGSVRENAAFSPDGRFLVLGFDPGLAVLYDAKTFRRLVALEAPHLLRVSLVRFAHGGKSLAVCGDGQHLQLWDLEALERELQARGLGWE